jgi:hypothetical protein
VELLFVQSAKRPDLRQGHKQGDLAGRQPRDRVLLRSSRAHCRQHDHVRFIPFWSEGADSFKSNAPNADISILDGKELRQVAAVLENPQLKGDDLTYTVRILQGDMPAKGSDVSVFFDIIGRPFTPMSFAGVARRNYRRACYY